MRACASALPRRGSAAMVLVLAAMALSACQSRTAGQLSPDPVNTASTSQASLSDTVKLGDAWQKNPGDTRTGLAYVAALERIGQSDRQVEVLGKLASLHPEDGTVQALYGKKLLAAGDSGGAVTALEKAASMQGATWQVQNALGSAYDDQGQYAAAQAAYQKALAMSPRQVQVLNNLGMSQTLAGDLKSGEVTLRQALAQPNSGAYPKIRQNLALAVGLQGRFDEARQIASTDLPPDQVDANMAYLQKMLAQPNTWQQLASGTNPGN